MIFKTLHRNERKTAKHEPNTKNQGGGGVTVGAPEG